MYRPKILTTRAMYNRALAGLGQTKMQMPESEKIYGGAYKDIWINPPHVDEKSLPGYDILVNGPGDARERWKKFEALNPQIANDIQQTFRYQDYARLDSATERRDARRDAQGNIDAAVSKYKGLILDTYYAWRAIEVAEYHQEHDSRVKTWKLAIASIATVAVATSFLGASAAKAATTAASTTGTAGAGTAAAASSSVLTPITVAAKPLALVGGKVVTAGTVAASAAAAAPAASALSPITVAAKPIAIKAATGAAASSLLQPVTVAAQPISAASLTTQAAAVVPKVVSAVNNVRTVGAILQGEIPPPPISLEGDNFTDYATSIAKDLMEKKLNDKITAAQEAELQNQIRELQARSISQLPPNYSAYPMPTVSAPVQSAMAQSKEENKTLQTALLLGIPILLAVLFKG